MQSLGNGLPVGRGKAASLQEGERQRRGLQDSGQGDQSSREQRSGASEGGVAITLCASPGKVTGEIHVINANSPGSTLYRVDAIKVCNLSREEESYRTRRDKLEIFMHHPFTEAWWEHQDHRPGSLMRGVSIFDGDVTDFHKVILCNMAIYLREAFNGLAG